MAKMKGLKITISGTYRTGNDDIVDFDNISGVIPFIDPNTVDRQSGGTVSSEELITAYARKRYALMWLSEERKRFPKYIKSIREVYIDSIEEVSEHDFSFLGKNIKQMTYKELQDLAVLKGLRSVPLFKKSGLRQSQIIAYSEYSDRILRTPVKYKAAGFNFGKQPPLVVSDPSTVIPPMSGLSNEAILDMEMKPRALSEDEAALSRSELEKIANLQKISFHPSISDANLYKKIFPSAA